MCTENAAPSKDLVSNLGPSVQFQAPHSIPASLSEYTLRQCLPMVLLARHNLHKTRDCIIPLSQASQLSSSERKQLRMWWCASRIQRKMATRANRYPACSISTFFEMGHYMPRTRDFPDVDLLKEPTFSLKASPLYWHMQLSPMAATFGVYILLKHNDVVPCTPIRATRHHIVQGVALLLGLYWCSTRLPIARPGLRGKSALHIQIHFPKCVFKLNRCFITSGISNVTWQMSTKGSAA